MTDIDLDALDPLDDGIDIDLDALDPVTPTPEATPVGTGAARLDYGDIDLDALDPLEPAPAAPTGLAALGGGDPLQGVDWKQVEENAPWVIPLVAGVGTAGMSLPLQLGASVLAGGAGRYLGGEDTMKWGSLAPNKILEGGILPDLAMPVLPNVAMGIGKGVSKAYGGLRAFAPDVTEAIDDITRGWDELGHVSQTTATARPIDEKDILQGGYDEVRGLLGSPVEAGSRSSVDELRQVAKRLDAFPKARNRIQRFVTKSAKDIWTQPAEGVRGKLGLRTTMPLSDRQDVRLLMEGYKTAADVSPEVVAAAGKLRTFYDQVGDLSERWGMFGPDAPRVRGYAGPLVTKPGQNVSSLAEETATAHGGKRALKYQARTERFDPTYHVEDAMEAFQQYAKSAPEKLGAAYSFGAPGAATSEGTREFGTIANELLNRARSRALGTTDRRAAEELIGSLKQVYHTGEKQPLLGMAGQAVGTTLLPSSWASQLGQQAWNIARPGLQNTVEGLTRYALDPEFRGLIKESGARGGSMAHLFREMGGDESLAEAVASKALGQMPASVQRGVSRLGGTRLGRTAKSLYSLLPDNLVGSAIGGSESLLRGPLASGYIPYTEDLIERALDAASTSGSLSRGLSRELAEAGLNADDFLNSSRYTPYQRSAHTLRNVHSNMAGRYQLMAGDPGQASSRLTGTAAGRLFGQFQPFTLGAARLAKTDILDPLWQGATRGDLSELGLGAGRLARLVPAGIGMAGISKALKEAYAAKPTDEWDLSTAPKDALKTIGGMPASLLIELLSATDKETGEHNWGEGAVNALSSLIPPVGNLEDVVRGKGLLLAANAISPSLGSMMTMASPAVVAHQKREAAYEKELKSLLSRRRKR